MDTPFSTHNDNPLAPIRRNGAFANSSIEPGIIKRVDTSTGTCEVITQSGRFIKEVVIPQEGGTPMSDSPCVIVMFGAERAFLMSTFKTRGRAGDAVGFGAPGDQSSSLRNGGHVLATQGGLMDVMADPWCRVSMIPESKTIKAHTKNLNVDFSPLSTFRVIQDDDTQSQFAELFVNSRFMHREGDKSADIQLSLGDTTQSELVHPTNVRSPFIAHLAIEGRKRTSSDTIRSYTLGIGHDQGVAKIERIENIEEETAITTRTGQFSGGEDGDILQEVEFDLGDNEKIVMRFEKSGKITLSNQSWGVTLSPDGALEMTNALVNAGTKLVIRGEDIYIGGQSGAEKLVLGESLVQRILGIERFLLNHNHLHPAGPTTGLTLLPSRSPDFLSEHNHTT